MSDRYSNSTFAEIYMLDERKFAHKSITKLRFSNRTAKRLRRAKVVTIMGLLKMTPAKMMEIDGFGVGCLEEIKRTLATLDDNHPTASTIRPRAASRPSLPNSEALTLAEKHGMNPEDYADVSISSVSFSVRVSNALLRNDITTIALLLQKSGEQLQRLRNLGKTSWAEIDACLVALRDKHGPTTRTVSETRTIAATRAFTADECRLMADGDFSFVDGEQLSDSDVEHIARYIEAQEILGKELALDCLEEPAKILPITSMFLAFNQKVAMQQKLQDMLDEVPAHRRKNPAIAYINTFTQDEIARETLLELYPSPNAPLDTIAKSKALDLSSLVLVTHFLSWCKYDLKEEIAQLFSALFLKERNWQVIQQRAQKKTLEHIGKQYGLTRERIRQLEAKIQRAFNAKQGRIKIISKINADKNNASLVTAANIAEYCTDNFPELLYLLQNCESSNFAYDKDLDVFVVGDDSLHERVFAFVEKLPDILHINEVPQYYEEAEEEYDLPREVVAKAFSESYKLTGDVYHRTTLTLADIYAEIIKEYFPDGIDAYDPATLARFRQLVFEKYGPVKLPENDRALTARIADKCVLCGRGRYRSKQKQYIPKKLAQRICSYIEDSDEVIFMTNVLFAVFEDELRQYGVDNKYYLQGVLRELYQSARAWV